jgi:site-specific DNA-methyltransferase (cytosine-N4-specific)
MDFVTVAETRNARSVWTIPTQPTPEAHFATFPEALAERCILAGSAEGDTVLDPFFGSGTVGRVAERLGRSWIGCELNPKYVEIAERRTAQVGLFK